MITVSLVYELQFVAKHFDSPLTASLQFRGCSPVTLLVTSDELEVRYQQELIWKEKIVGPESNFGVESVDTIARIINAIDTDQPWKDKFPHIFS